MAFYVDYSSSLPGTRNGAVGLTDTHGDILAAPNTGTDLAGALALYPGTQVYASQTTQTLYEPQGLAVTGNGGTLFMADEGGYLTAAPRPISTARFGLHGDRGRSRRHPTKVGTFATPTAVALDAVGDLYVADYSGTVTVVPVSYNSTTAAIAWPASGRL